MKWYDRVLITFLLGMIYGLGLEIREVLREVHLETGTIMLHACGPTQEPIQKL